MKSNIKRLLRGVALREALYYEKLDKEAVRCLLCPHKCFIKPGQRGFCRARKNEDNRLYALNDGQVTSLALDPVEKKPLYHFYPGKLVLSVGTWGCNLQCQFCQNWQIAHKEPDFIRMSPQEVVSLALEQQEQRGNIGLAYTYSEPFMWFEYLLDTCKIAKQAGLKNILVTNGYVNPEPLGALLPYVDAMNIDVKGFQEDFYRLICAGKLDPVCKTVALSWEQCHVELTTLLIPGRNDKPEEIKELAQWVASMDERIPLHLSRYFPQYKMNVPKTPLDTLRKAKEIASQYLAYVYLGNVSLEGEENTKCLACGAILLERTGYTTNVHVGQGNICPHCGRKTDIIMDK